MVIGHRCSPFLVIDAMAGLVESRDLRRALVRWQRGTLSYWGLDPNIKPGTVPSGAAARRLRGDRRQ
jgi:hypothetical protein